MQKITIIANNLNFSLNFNYFSFRSFDFERASTLMDIAAINNFV
jgi:hypothetical protein